MTGTEPLDRDSAEDAGPAYRDRLGVVSEGRQMSRPALLAAAAAVCATGLLAGLGLFGGTTPKPRPSAPVAGVVKAANLQGSRAGEPARDRPSHRLHTHHPAGHVPHVPWTVYVTTHLSHKAMRHVHKGNAGHGAPHGVGRHSPLRGKLRRSELPATARPAAPSGTPRTAPRPTSATTAPAASR